MSRRETEQISSFPDGREASEQPKWRQDFPIDWPQDEYVARRDFTKFLVLTSFAFVVGHLWIILQNLFRSGRGKPPIREIARLDALPVGGTLTFHYPGPHDGCLLVRTGDRSFVAYDQKCTHLSCPVRPEPEKGTLHCPCHEGDFDLATGRPIAGPPRRPLTLVELEIRNDRIYAVGIRERVT